MLDIAAEASGRDRYLPIDAPWAKTTAAESALLPVPGPRTLGYGMASDWVTGIDLRDGTSLYVAGDIPDDVSEDDVEFVTFRTIPPPSNSRTVLGLFLDMSAAAAALVRLAEDRPDALVAAELCDRGAGRWLANEVLDAECVVLLRVEGEADPVARASRRAWQAIELSQGVPRIYEREWGEWQWREVHPDLGDRGSIVRIDAPFEVVPQMYDAVRETASILGDVAVRAHALLGITYGYLPNTDRQREALGWLEGQVRTVGGRMEIIAP